MAVCSFLGHMKLYDHNVEENLRTALVEVICQHDKVEFVFFEQRNAFLDLCLTIVQEAKYRYPDKEIKLTCIETRAEGCEPQKRKTFSCIYDRVITTFIAPALHRPVAPWKRTKREIIRGSDYLICYHYPELRERGLFDLCGFAHRRPALTVLDVADGETARFIHASIARLLPKQQAIIHALDTGKSFRCIGEVYHVSGTAISAADARARRLLRKYALERLHHMLPPQNHTVSG